MTRRDSGGTPEETSGASRATSPTASSKPAQKPPQKPPQKPAAGGKTGAGSPPRPRPDSFLAHRRGASAAAPPREDDAPDPVPEFEPVSLGGEPGEAEKERSPERAAWRARLQKEMEAAPFAAQIGLRLDYADNGVSRVRLPTASGNAEPGPLEGGVVGTACVAAGHFAAASLAPGVGIRLVEFKISILGPVQGDLLAIGEVVRKGRTLVACRMEVVEDNDRVVAIGLGTYFLQHQ